MDITQLNPVCLINNLIDRFAHARHLYINTCKYPDKNKLKINESYLEELVLIRSLLPFYTHHQVFLKIQKEIDYVKSQLPTVKGLVILLPLKLDYNVFSDKSLLLDYSHKSR